MDRIQQDILTTIPDSWAKQSGRLNEGSLGFVETYWIVGMFEEGMGKRGHQVDGGCSHRSVDWVVELERQRLGRVEIERKRRPFFGPNINLEADDTGYLLILHLYWENVHNKNDQIEKEKRADIMTKKEKRANIMTMSWWSDLHRKSMLQWTRCHMIDDDWNEDES